MYVSVMTDFAKMKIRKLRFLTDHRKYIAYNVSIYFLASSYFAVFHNRFILNLA